MSCAAVGEDVGVMLDLGELAMTQDPVNRGSNGATRSTTSTRRDWTKPVVQPRSQALPAPLPQV